MSVFGNAKNLSTKLPAMVVGAAFISALVVGIVSFQTAKREAVNAHHSKTDALLTGKEHELSSYLNNIRRDIGIISENPGTIYALKAFIGGWESFYEDHTKILQKAYIEDNPNELGEKHKLDKGTEGSLYDDVHERYHPWFRKLLVEHDYYDIFLFDLEGNLIYSVYKELDFATNLQTGEWKDSDLGNAFRAALNSERPGNVSFFDFRPYGPSNGAPASFMSAPIFEKGKLKGVLAYQMPIDAINEVMTGTTGLGDTGETFIVGEDHFLRSNSKLTVADDILATNADNAAIADALSGRNGNVQANNRNNQLAIFDTRPVSFPGAKWALVAVQETSEIYAPIAEMRNNMVLYTIGVLTILAFAGYWMSRSVTRPISSLVTQMGHLAEGDTDIDLASTSRNDEIGDMSRAVAVFRDNAIERAKLRDESEGVAEARMERQKRIDTLIEDFRSVVRTSLDGVGANTQDMQSAVQSLSATADETSAQAGAASSASEAASQNVLVVATAAEELSGSIDQIGRQIMDTNVIVSRANDAADATNVKVAGLSEAASKIGKVVSLIQDIAEQTNLLALNATIEAARAGEAGKGFAVVASEVKELATQTGKATEEIGSQISNIQQETESAVAAIGEISEIMKDVNVKTGAIATAVEEQGASTTEISRNVQQAAAGSATVSDNIGGVTLAAGETTQSIGQIMTAAEDVARQASSLSEVVEEFMEKVSAA